jgi:DNA modification methylase
LANDDRCDWREAFLLTDAPIAYVWHSALYCREAFDALEASGYEVRQQLIWVKQVHALSRAHYQWKHESCLYAVRKGASASWKGGRKQTTVWEEPSPIMAFGAGGDDGATAHPTQKPLALYERAILNHTERGAVVYEPFAGSGSCLIAAEKTGRRCFAIEIDPGWCDTVRDRYAAFAAAGKAGC